MGKLEPFCHLIVSLLLKHFGVVFANGSYIFISRKRYDNTAKSSKSMYSVTFPKAFQQDRLSSLRGQFCPSSLICDTPGISHSCQVQVTWLSLELAQAHRWKNTVWSDRSQFLLWHSDVRIRIWCKQHEMMESAVQVMLWGIFSYHTLGPLVPAEHPLNAKAYRRITGDHPVVTTVYHLLLVASSRLTHYATKLRSAQACVLRMTTSSLHSQDLRSHQISIHRSTF